LLCPQMKMRFGAPSTRDAASPMARTCAAPRGVRHLTARAAPSLLLPLPVSLLYTH
jgi:hypothetical protein